MSIHITPVEPSPSALLDHCMNHPDQTTKNSETGWGFAGGGIGSYFICGICCSVFGKVADSDDEE